MVAIMWVKSFIITSVTLALLSFPAHAQLKEDCYFHNNIWWGRCVDKVLQNTRDKIIRKLDPLPVADFKEGKLEAKDFVIRGLSAYNVAHWEIKIPRLDQISFSANISWPSLTVDLSLHAPAYKRNDMKEHIIGEAHVHVTIGKASASIETTLNEAGYDKLVTLTFQPSGTSVSLNVSCMRVDAKLSRRLAEFVDWTSCGLDLSTAENKASNLSVDYLNMWWRQNKPKLEARACAALDEVFKKYVASELLKVVKF